LSSRSPPTDPFSTSVPENFDSSVDAAALCARFNPRGLYAGHYIAVGRLDGVVAVIDFETKNIVRWLEGHVKAVTTVWSVSTLSLSSRSGRPRPRTPSELFSIFGNELS
jgi:COMPASS component SWD1